MSGVQQKSSVPCPISQAKGTKLLILSSAVPPGFHPCTDAGRLSERRNGAHRPALLSFRPTARERTSACARAEALSAGEASLFAAVRLPTLSVAAFGVFRSWSSNNHESSYHISGRFASGAGRFRGISAFFCVLLGDFLLAEACRQRQALSVTTPEPRRLSGQVPKYQRTNTVKRTLPRWQTCVLLAK